MVTQKMVRIEVGKMTNETKKILDDMKKNLKELQISVESYKIELVTQVNKVPMEHYHEKICFYNFIYL